MLSPDFSAWHPGYVPGARICEPYEKMTDPNFADKDFGGITNYWAWTNDQLKGLP